LTLGSATQSCSNQRRIPSPRRPFAVPEGPAYIFG